MDRYLINALLPLITAEFLLTHQQGGELVGSFVIGYAIFSPIFGYLGDRLHRPTLMCIGVLLWAVATASSGMASSLAMLIGARIMIGVGEASYGTIAPGYIKDCESDPAKLNWFLSLFYTAIPVGSALGYVLGGVLAEHYSWRGAFYWAAVPAGCMAFLLLLFPETKHKTRESIDLISGAKKIIANEMLLFAIGGYMLNTFALTSIATFVPSYGQELGFSLTEINAAFGGILVGTGFVGTLIGGKVASRIASKSGQPTAAMLRFIAILSLAAVPFLAMSFMVSSQMAFLALCAVAELAIFAGLASINTIIVLESPPHLVTLTQGITILMINVFGYYIGPQIIGAISDKMGFRFGLQGTTVAMCACALIWLTGAKRRDEAQRVS